MSLLSDLAETVERLDSGSVWVRDRNGQCRVWLGATGVAGVYDQHGHIRVWLWDDGMVGVYDQFGQCRTEAKP